MSFGVDFSFGSKTVHKRAKFDDDFAFMDYGNEFCIRWVSLAGHTDFTVHTSMLIQIHIYRHCVQIARTTQHLILSMRNGSTIDCSRCLVYEQNWMIGLGYRNEKDKQALSLINAAMVLVVG